MTDDSRTDATSPDPEAPADGPGPRFFDGNAACSTATRTLHMDPLEGQGAVAPTGRSLDTDTRSSDKGGAPDAPPADVRKSPFALVRTKAALLQNRRVAGALEKIEELFASRTHRRWIRNFRMRSRSDTVDPFGLDPVITEHWRPFLEILYRSYFRVEVSGIEHIPDTGGAIIVANHGGVLPYDSAMLMYALRYDHPAHRTARPLVGDVAFQLPFLGTTLSRIGCVRASQENAERLLDAGYVVVVFPEGAKGATKLYSQRHQLQRFGRGGFVKLALRTGAPVIPAALFGADEAMPILGRLPLGNRADLPYLPITPTFPWLGPLGLLPLPSPWAIRFSEPMTQMQDLADERDAVLITQLNEQVRGRIQTMLDDLGAERAHRLATR